MSFIIADWNHPSIPCPLADELLAACSNSISITIDCIDATAVVQKLFPPRDNNYGGKKKGMLQNIFLNKKSAINTQKQISGRVP